MKKIKIKLLNYAKKHHYFMSLLRIASFVLGRFKYLLYYFSNNIDDKLIIFESFKGKKYCDSPKALYEEIIKNDKYKDYKFVWAFKNPDKYKFLLKNRNTSLVKYNSKKYLIMYSKAKYWFTNSRIPEIILKKSNQKYIQCWHGTPLKKLGFDLEVEGQNAMNSIKDIRKKYEVDAKKMDYMISPSKFCTEKFISSFNLKKYKKENIVIEKGYPRNDFLVNYTNEDVKKIKKKLNIPNKKVILYAPTWRDNQHQSGLGYTYKTEVDFDYLKKKLEKEYIILFRAHYFVANSFDFKKYNGFIYNVSDYDDINELYIISDILITDYSSVFFDYSILKRPIIFYMYDLDEYKNKLRDFYIELKDLPGNIVYNEKDLINEIKNTINFKYNKKYEKFNKTYTYLEDGNSSKRVIEEIID